MTNMRPRVSSYQPCATQRRQAGLSIVELMVALTIGLMLLAGVLSVVMNSSRSYRELTNSSQQLENGRYAMQMLRDEIRHAGFYGEFSRLPDPTIVPNPCETTDPQLEAAIGVPVQGQRSLSAPVDLTACMSSANYLAGTAVLVLRRVETAPVELAGLTPGGVYLQARPRTMVLQRADADAAANAASFSLTKRDGTTPADIWPYRTDIFYISACSRCEGGGDGIPALSRLVLTPTGFEREVLVEGIENLQLAYGVDLNGNGAVDQYIDDPEAIAAAQWGAVLALRIGLLARNERVSAGYTDEKSYVLAGVDVAPGGSFRRHAYNALVRANNASARRE